MMPAPTSRQPDGLPLAEILLTGAKELIPPKLTIPDAADVL